MFHWVFEDGVQEGSGWTTPGDPTRTRRTRQFRSWRGGNRWHAACDLVVPRGTPIRALCNGEVLQRGHFYDGTWSLTVRHEHPGYAPFIVRYGEVLPPDAGGTLPEVGSAVTGGHEIAQVGQLNSGGSMLHFELYAGSRASPSLSIPHRWDDPPDTYTAELRQEIIERGWHPDFQRRADLADPSAFLQALKRGEDPPAPVAWGGTATPSTVIEFGEDEVDHVIVPRPGGAAPDRSGWREPAAPPRCRLPRRQPPSWRETYLGPHGGPDDDLYPRCVERRGPDDV